MRMFLLGILLFLPLNANADCHEYDGNAYSCRDVAGCYYSTNSGECWDCPSNSNINSIGSYCPQNGMCDNGEQSPDGRCQCPTPFNLSTLGNDDVENCYTPCATGSDNYDTHTKDCGLAYGNHVFDSLSVSCIQNDILTMTDEDYHIETLGDNNYGCYLNNRDCNKFDVSWQETYTGVTLETVTITGTAHWNNNNYNTDECSATAIFNDQRQLVNCKTKRLCPVSSSTVANATTSIQYNNRNATGAYYYCTECLSSGHYPTTIKPTPQQLHLPNCNNPDGGYKACSCAQIEIGYYGTCNWTSTQPLDVCSPTPCPTGKTTNTPQSTSIDDCHYTDQTKFCDAKGCFNITDAANGDWNWTDIP